MAYHAYNIGRQPSQSWVRDFDYKLVRQIDAGDWILTFSNFWGFLGAGRVISHRINGERTNAPVKAGPGSSEQLVQWLYVVDSNDAAFISDDMPDGDFLVLDEADGRRIVEELWETWVQRGVSLDEIPAHYWLVWDAFRQLSKELNRPINVREISERIKSRYPEYNTKNTRPNLALMSVNDQSRGHYQRMRPLDFLRSDQGDMFDRLYKRSSGKTAATYELYDPIRHGIWELQPDYKGRPHLITRGTDVSLIDAAMELAEGEVWGAEIRHASEEDLRVRALRAVVQRRGQPRFRAALMRAYGGRCAMTNCAVEDALEAAHIKPHMGQHTMRADFGLLLRADVHTLFDIGHIWIDASTMTVRVSPELRKSEYGSLHEKPLQLPKNSKYHPNREHLEFHARSFNRAP